MLLAFLSKYYTFPLPTIAMDSEWIQSTGAVDSDKGSYNLWIPLLQLGYHTQLNSEFSKCFTCETAWR